MNLVSFFSQVNDLPGSFLQIGFDKGEETKTIFDAMNQGTLTKRETFIFDSFTGKTSGRLGKAMDMRFDLTNPNKKVSVVRGTLTSTLPSNYNGSKIACIYINVEGYEETLHTLSSIHPYLVRDGLVFVEYYNKLSEVTNAVNDFIKQNNLSHQVFLFENNTYIRNKISPVSFKVKKINKSDRAQEEKIPVPSPKTVQPFADRYTKPVVEDFVPKKVIKPGLTPVDKKVTK